MGTDNKKEDKKKKVKKKSRLQIAQEKAQAAIDSTNESIEELGKNTAIIYEELTAIQDTFDQIRNIPSDKKLQYDELKQHRLNWKEQADKIERDYNNAAIKNAGAGAAGAGLGVAVVTMGPTVAMGVATTFGVASTGTAISTLSGAAATNAALAWLGGGALAAGGGGMAAGEAFLTLAGPVGWAIAGVALLASGLLFWKTKVEQNRIEDIFTLISDRDVKSYELAVVELNERITRIVVESSKLAEANKKIKGFGLDYDAMTEEQQYELGAYVNLMSSSTQLLINPIQGLMPKYSEEDFETYVDFKGKSIDVETCNTYKELIISMANFLYKIELDDKDKKLLWKALKKNKKMLKSLNIKKKEFGIELFDTVLEALSIKYM